MTLRLSTALRDYVNANGSMKKALHNGKLDIYSGAQPATADSAPTGVLLCTITESSLARTAEVLASGTITLAGSAGSISGVTVDGKAIVDAAVPFNASLNQTAIDLAAAINNSLTTPDFTASASGAVVTVFAPRGLGAAANGLVLDATTVTMTSTDVNLSGGVSAANGLKFGVSSAGTLTKLASQVWSGLGLTSGTAGWFRVTGSVADTGVADSSASQIRLDGSISTSGAQLNMSNTGIVADATQTISSFPLNLPTS